MRWADERRTLAVLTGVAALAAAVAACSAPQSVPALAATSGGTDTRCSTCHPAVARLPARHPQVKTPKDSIADCVVCHASPAVRTAANPVAVYLHASHNARKVECTTCHTYDAQGRFGVVGEARPISTVAPEAFARVRQSGLNAEGSTFLAGLHDRAKMSCSACHGTQLSPGADDAGINAACVKCHGGYERLGPATRTRPKNPAANPHASHLGKGVACTTCHEGHQPSRVSCLGCHANFDMPIPGGGGMAPGAVAR